MYAFNKAIPPNVLTVDKLGLLQAQITVLQQQEKVLKEQIKKELGVGNHAGALFDCLVVRSVRSVLPIEVARDKLKELGVKARWFRAHEVESVITSVKVTAKKPDALVRDNAVAA